MANKYYHNPFRTAGGLGQSYSSRNPGGQERSVADAASPLQQLTAEENLFTFCNKSGSTIAEGQALVPDTTALTVVTATAWAQSADTALTIAEDLTSEEGLFRLIFTNSTAVFDAVADGIVVIGVDEYGETITEGILTDVTASAVLVSANLYQEITSITMTSGVNATQSTAKIAVTTKCVNALTPAAATDDLRTFVGIARGSVNSMPGTAIPDEDFGYVSMVGPVTKALVEPTTQVGGEVLATSNGAAGTLGTVTTKTGSGLAVMLDANGAHQAAASLLWIVMGGAPAEGAAWT